MSFYLQCIKIFYAKDGHLQLDRLQPRSVAATGDTPGGFASHNFSYLRGGRTGGACKNHSVNTPDSGDDTLVSSNATTLDNMCVKKEKTSTWSPRYCKRVDV